MNKPVISNWPLFFGLTMIMVGNGLQGTLLGVRASIENFDSFTTGLIMSFYYFGFLIGSRLSPQLIQNVGHIRVFAALASLASTTVLMHGLFVDPWFWAIIRLFTGFSYAGLYIVIESWLNDASDNKSRGKVMATYMVLCYVGMICGQFLMNLAPPSEIELFVMTSVLVSLALLPISLSKRPAPFITVPKKIALRELYRLSPLGVTGMCVSGMIASIFFSMGPVFTTKIGYDVSQTSIYMIILILGGVCSQMPIGWLSDRFDRRRVLTAVMLFIGVLSSIAYVMPTESFISTYVMIFFLGGLSLSIYSLALAHTNDHLEKEQIMSASATMVLINGVGASISPLLVSTLMDVIDYNSFYATIAVISFAMFTFALYRMSSSQSVAAEDQGTYIMTPVRTSSPMTESIMKEQESETSPITPPTK